MRSEEQEENQSLAEDIYFFFHAFDSLFSENWKEGKQNKTELLNNREASYENHD